MAAKYPKKPTLLKYRRKPKPTASLSTLEGWLKHVRDTDAANKEKINNWKKRKAEIDKEHKRKEQLKKTVAGIGAVDYRNMWHKAHNKRRKTAAVGSVGKKRKTSAKRKPAKSAKRRSTRRR